MTVATALTIAGSDSGGGAGIQADLKTFSAFRVFGTSVLTALTAQNSVGVHGVFDVPPEFIGRQIDAVLSDIGADVV
jgi:hydroxymethylpyrimidine/phosphomethylpyrimidine kinase